jgi:tetratricopeptide (TPR) repeat protein
MRRSTRLLRPAVGFMFAVSAGMTAVPPKAAPSQNQSQTPSPPVSPGPQLPSPGVPDGAAAQDRAHAPVWRGVPFRGGVGRVLMADGTPPPEPVPIEMVCGAVVTPRGFTDSKGAFTLRYDSSAVDVRAPNSGGPEALRAGGPPAVRGQAARAATDCFVRARLAGYRSTTLQLSSYGDFDLGTLHLHRLSDATEATISLTSLMAPKQATAAFEKGTKASARQKWAEAVQHFEKAVRLYPKYALAWFELGRARKARGNREAAAAAYRQSISQEPKFVKPYIGLASLLVLAGSWEDAATISAQGVKLDPISSPSLWLYGAMANFHLGKATEAEAEARQAIKMDSERELPVAEYILAALQLNRGNLQAAAEHMRTYLELAPNGENAPAARQQLVRIESRLASRTEATDTAPR